jgi:hypothetical protein
VVCVRDEMSVQKTRFEISSADTAGDALARPEIESDVTGMAASRIECAPDIPFASATGSFFAATRLLIVGRHGIENVFRSLTFDNHGEFAIILSRRLLISQLT